MPNMKGKICLITGGTNGIGKVTAQELARMGTTVVIVGRNAEKTAQVVAEIRAITGNENVDMLLADLSSQQAIRQLASEFKSKYSRIINVSSNAHKSAKLDFDNLQGERSYSAGAYGASKLANILFTIELARRLEGTGVTVNALHPGLVNTGFGKNNSGFLMKLIGAVVPFIARSPEKGAETSIYLAASPDVHIVTGKYFVDSKVAQAAAQVADPTVAKKLWDVSSVLVKLTDTMPAAV